MLLVSLDLLASQFGLTTEQSTLRLHHPNPKANLSPIVCALARTENLDKSKCFDCQPATNSH